MAKWNKYVFTRSARCPEGSAICAMKTYVQSDENSSWKDDIGLMGVGVLCCKTDETCFRHTKTEQAVQIITVCDGTKHIEETTCTFEKTTGIERSESHTTGGSRRNETSFSWGFTRSVSMTQEKLQASASLNIGGSSTSGYRVDWSEMESSTWREGSKSTITIRVPPGIRTVIKMPVGRCGNVKVFASVYYIESTFADGTPVPGTFSNSSSPGAINANKALYMAASRDNLYMVEFLVNKLRADVNSKHVRGFTPLMAAIRADRYSIAAFLIKNGAIVNDVRPDGWFPLIEAACRGFANMVQLLLDNGADPNMALSDGKTAYDHAVLHKKFRVASILQKYKQIDD